MTFSLRCSTAGFKQDGFRGVLFGVLGVFRTVGIWCIRLLVCGLGGLFLGVLKVF